MFKINNIIFYNFFIWILIASLLKIEDKYFFIGIFIIGMINIIYIYYINLLKIKFAKHYGNIIYDRVNPKPFTSMIAGINKINYRIKDIEKIDFMSYDLNQSCEYIEPILDKVLSKNKDIKINLIGYGDESSCKNINNENINYFYLKDKISEHKNLIYLKNGKILLWYEPNHKIIDGEHKFRQGAYLIDPKSEVCDEIQNLIKNLKQNG